MTSDAQLGEALDTIVDELVKAGRYPSRNDVLREGVRLVDERERRLAALDVTLARGIAAMDDIRLGPDAERLRGPGDGRGRATARAVAVRR